MIDIAICCTQKSHSINKSLIKVYETKKHFFNDDINLKYAFCYYPFLLNGDVTMDKDILVKQFKRYIEFYIENNLTICLFVTNPYIDNFLINDIKSNSFLSILEKTQKNKSYIVVGNIEVGKQIQQKYPNFNIMYDIKSFFNSEIDLDELSSSNFCLYDYDYNSNIELLSSLLYKENIIIDTNHPCDSYCVNKNICKMNVSLYNMLCTSRNELKNCLQLQENYYRTVSKRSHYIKYDDFKEKYYNLGVNKIKINDPRTNFINTIEGYVDFLSKNEFKDDLRYVLLNNIKEDKWWE